MINHHGNYSTDLSESNVQFWKKFIFEKNGVLMWNLIQWLWSRDLDYNVVNAQQDTELVSVFMIAFVQFIM